jgi:hypothetical protein
MQVRLRKFFWLGKMRINCIVLSLMHVLTPPRSLEYGVVVGHRALENVNQGSLQFQRQFADPIIELLPQ